MTELTELDLVAACDALEKGECSARELTQAHLNAMASDKARALNAFVLETPERALQMADAADARIKAGDARPLEGIPLGVKDLFCTKGVRTTACSNILGDFTPPYESTVTQNLWDAGAVLLGKLNHDEFAMGSSNEHSRFGAVVNPWGQGRVAGGSSGGSAAAVAAHLGIAATGTDTGGSIRQPAAFTATVGLKPTYGRCSRWGIIAFASSLDQAGPITRTVRDAAIMLGAMAGHDPKDSTSIDRPVPDYESALTGDIKGLRVGIPEEYNVPWLPPKVVGQERPEFWDNGATWLKDAGAEIVPVSLPHTRYALPAYYIIAPAEASSNLARYDGVRYGKRIDDKDIANIDALYEATRAAGFGAEVQRRVLIGTYVLSAGYYDAYYRKALQVRRLVAQDFARAFEKCDLLLTPTTPDSAFALGAQLNDPIAMYYNDVLTVPTSLAGLPAVSLPVDLYGGLPLGLQLIGQAFDEATLLRVANVLEQAAGFTHKADYHNG